MHYVTPQVYLVARPTIVWESFESYLRDVGATEWLASRDVYGNDAHDMVEAAGRMCYRSWAPGLNPNVTRVRADQRQYLANILSSGHGSVLEHANYSFIFHGVSRVFTHELVRHRAGTAISQESMRYVRLDDIPFWMPEWAQEDEALRTNIEAINGTIENFLEWYTDYYKLDDPLTPFHVKKEKTSFMRRIVGNGVGTDIFWTANIRALRHVIEARTDKAAEEELRLVFDEVARIMIEEAPDFFQDFMHMPDGSWKPDNHKV